MNPITFAVGLVLGFAIGWLLASSDSDYSLDIDLAPVNVQD